MQRSTSFLVFVLFSALAFGCDAADSEVSDPGSDHDADADPDSDIEPPPQRAPNLTAIASGEATVGTPFAVAVAATDADGDALLFALDPETSPADATIIPTDNESAVVWWTPAVGDQGTTVPFKVIVTDDGNPPLSDAEEFQVAVAALPTLAIDLNGADEAGTDTTATFAPGGAPVSIVDDELMILASGTGLQAFGLRLPRRPIARRNSCASMS
jgi:hypothetical protein